MTEVTDSEMLKIERVFKWAQGVQGSSRDIDQFAKDLEERINHCGFTCEVKVYDTEQADTYGFEVDLTGRVAGSVFDPDRQVHEVTHNLLELPGQDTGFIPSREYLDKLVARERSKGHHD